MAFNSAAFGRFFNLTRSSIATGPEYIANLAQQTKYPFFRLLRDKQPFRFARGGKSITEAIQIGDANTFGFFNPADPANLQFVNTSRTMEIPWAFGRSHKVYTDAEYELHTNGGDKARIKDFMKWLDQEQRTAHVNGLNNTLFSRPNSALMESASPTTRTPYSIPAFISEDTVRFRPPAAQWTVNTIQGIDVTTENFRNQVSTYDAGQFSDPMAGVLGAMDDMLLKLIFETVPEAGAAFKPTGASDIIIFTNRDGYRRMQSVCRQNNDRLRSLGDPAVGDVAFDGAPFYHAPQLDTELLDQTRGASAAYTGTAYLPGYPRYFFVNKTNLHPVFLKGQIMADKPLFEGMATLPDTNALWTFSTFNTMTNNRNRQGIVCPA